MSTCGARSGSGRYVCVHPAGHVGVVDPEHHSAPLVGSPIAGATVEWAVYPLDPSEIEDGMSASARADAERAKYAKMVAAL